MNDLSDIGTIKSVLSRHGFNFSKSLGQNFLIDSSVCPRMAQLSGADKQTGVIEVGPGVGVLTCELAEYAGKVVAIELDKRLLPVLNETLSEYKNVEIINDDILKIDLKELIQTKFTGMDVIVCANLPYYITSPVIMRLLEEKLPVKSLTVMVQKEAAVRICALPGKRECGAVSVAVRYYAEPEILFDVPRTSFLPAPHVDSAVIKLNIRQNTEVAVKDEQKFFSLVKAAFGQRRKTVLNSVSAGLSLSKQEVGDALEHAQIASNVRAEQLSMKQFSELTNFLFR